MADFYVDNSVGSNANAGTSWATAKATLSGGLLVAKPGDYIYVAPNHFESSNLATYSLSSRGLFNSLVKVICADNTINQPPTGTSSTAYVYITGGSASQTLVTYSNLYVDGVNFVVGRGGSTGNIQIGSASSDGMHIFKNCKLFHNNQSSTTSNFTINGGSRRLVTIFDNVAVLSRNASQVIAPFGGTFIWSNTLFPIHSSVPIKFLNLASNTVRLVFENMNFAALSACNHFSFIPSSFDVHIENCIFPPTLSVVLSTAELVKYDSGEDFIVKQINCSWPTISSYNATHTISGIVSTNTNVYCASGANDNISSYSVFMSTVSTGQPDMLEYSPLKTDKFTTLITQTTPELIIKVPICSNGYTLKDTDIWLSGSYPSATNKFTSFNTAGSVVATGQSLPLDTTSQWLTASSGLSSASLQVLSASIGPIQPGLLSVRVNLARPNTIVYVNPEINLDYSKVYQTGSTFLNISSTPTTQQSSPQPFGYSFIS